MSRQVDLSQLAIERTHDPPNSSSGRGRWLSRYALPVLIFGGLLGLAGWASFDLMFPPIDVTVVPIHATKTVEAGETLFKTAGWVEPRPTPIRVAALAPGVVEKLLVVDDQPVEAGEPIAELIKDDAQLAFERAQADVKLKSAEVQQEEAALAAAKTRLEQPVHLEAPLREAEAMLAKLETLLTNLPFEIRRAEADYKFARIDYEGKKAAEGAISGRLVDEAKSRMESALASVDELESRLASLKSEKTSLQKRRDALQRVLELKADEIEAYESAKAKLNSAQARLEDARVALAEAQLRLDRMTIKAPVDGRILDLVSDPGTRLVDAMGVNRSFDGSTVVTMYKPDSLQVRVDVRFADVPNVSLGQTVTIFNQASAEQVEGRVLYISSVADIQKNTLQVKVEMDDPPDVFKPEMLVDVAFLAPPAKEGEQKREVERLFAPAEYVRSGESGSFVWVADQSEGIARRVGVSLGKETPTGLVEVQGSLNAADRIIAQSQGELSDGSRIRITGEPNRGNAAGRSSSTSKSINRLPQGGQSP